MPREYRHISIYENEISELEEKVLTQQQIANKLDFIKQSIKMQNENLVLNTVRAAKKRKGHRRVAPPQ